jgi:hypothetical protein
VKKPKPRQARETRATLGARFKILLLDAGLSPEDAGKILHVTPRTIRYWISGKVLVPYAAYRLLRIMRLYELPLPGWDGWKMHSGRLWSPEGYGFWPGDSDWWGLLVRRAQGFGRVYDRNVQLTLAMQRSQGLVDGVATAGAAPGSASDGGADGGAASSPAAAGGRAAKPTGPNLLLDHFRKWNKDGAFFAPPFSLGKQSFSYAMKNGAATLPGVSKFPQCEKSTKGDQA